MVYHVNPIPIVQLHNPSYMDKFCTMICFSSSKTTNSNIKNDLYEFLSVNVTEIIFYQYICSNW